MTIINDEFYLVRWNIYTVYDYRTTAVDFSKCAYLVSILEDGFKIWCRAGAGYAIQKLENISNILFMFVGDRVLYLFNLSI